ncbi:hypothetical protein G3T14_15305 [Methylobacterium sp. BTF04]|uniref:polysaccharide biosynthesis/export family protein n=1 Tax=Methylobacterium sp. BTF04 TaxID=2708300 RepID=UPI0013D50F3D|nr:polysaccharide biosynthesis/export family protein [Methylobacterium sp. BTF04]NEU13489.1 hypothetical protein [Methylobacterium sp. BTF04]
MSSVTDWVGLLGICRTQAVRCARLSLLAVSLLGPAPLSAAEMQYKLGAQDRLRIHVYEWPALTGEFTVGAEGLIALPLIGDIPVIGLQPSELAQEISIRLKSRATLTELPNAAVAVTQYRPYYIIGSVEKSGEYAYRPGMLVLNAVSIAGGAYRRPDMMNWASIQERIKTEGELQVLGLKKKDLLAKETRLKAEIDQLGKRPVQIAGPLPEGLSVSGGEKSLFLAQREHQQNEVRALQQAITLHEDEILSLKAQRDAADKQRIAVQRELGEVRDNVARGLAPTNRVLPLERTVAQIEREQKELDTQVLRARQQINTAERTIASVHDDRTIVVIRDLLEVQTLIQETNGKLASAERIIQESAAYSGEGSGGASDPPVRFAFAIVRVEASETREFEAFETTPVQPGDILKVHLQRRDEAPAHLAQMKSSLPRLTNEAKAMISGDRDR